MPRGRKRNDPDAAPIDGDYSLDQVSNKHPDFEYGLVHQDDFARYRGMGYVFEERGPDSARPLWDIGDDATSGYAARDLRLMKIPKELRARIDAGPKQTAEARMATMKRDFKSFGGEFGKVEAA